MSYARESNQSAAPLQPAGFTDFDMRAQIPERLVISSINLDTPVVESGWNETTDPAGSVFKNWDVADYVAGWHVSSDKLGLGGNVVLSGHNNILGSIFWELDQLEVGDVVTIWSGGTQYNYAIDEVVIVPERDAT